MKEYTAKDIRNIVVIGASGTGKTTFMDGLLYYIKKVNRFGSVDAGNSNMDYRKEEIERKMSVVSSIAQFEYNKIKYNILDTPGYIDFIGEVIGSSAAVDNSLILIDGSTNSIRYEDKKLARLAKDNDLTQTFFINKLDKENIDLEKILSELKKSFGGKALPIAIPDTTGDGITGIADILKNKFYKITDSINVSEEEIPASIKDTVEKYRKELIEAAAGASEELMEKFFAEDTLSNEDLLQGFITGFKNKEIYPVICGATRKNIGITSFFDIMSSALSPEESIIKVNEKEIKTSDNELRALIFATTTVEHVGEINFVRLFSGSIESGQEVFNSTKNEKERIGQINYLIGKESIRIEKLCAGDIGCLIKLKYTGISDTLTNTDSSFIFPRIKFPKPIMSYAIIPVAKDDQDKLSSGLHGFTKEDPTITVHVDKEFKQTILSGMGDVQLDIVLKKLKEKYKVDLTTEKPEIPYRETVRKKAEGQGKYKKQSGGRGQYGDVFLRIEPLPKNIDPSTLSPKEELIDLKTGGKLLFVDAIVGGVVPGKYIPAVKKGLENALREGVVAKYPTMDIKATLYYGSYHEVDSSDMAFQIAASLAFKNVTPNASPILLEPIYKLKVEVLEQYMGDIMSDINTRRGKILGMNSTADGTQIINALVPLSEMHKYSSDLRSLTKGSGDFEFEFSNYEKVPDEVTQKIIQDRKTKVEE